MKTPFTLLKKPTTLVQIQCIVVCIQTFILCGTSGFHGSLFRFQIQEMGDACVRWLATVSVVTLHLFANASREWSVYQFHVCVCHPLVFRDLHLVSDQNRLVLFLLSCTVVLFRLLFFFVYTNSLRRFTDTEKCIYKFKKNFFPDDFHFSMCVSASFTSTWPFQQLICRYISHL